jgi:hypothetical protein
LISAFLSKPIDTDYSPFLGEDYQDSSLDRQSLLYSDIPETEDYDLELDNEDFDSEYDNDQEITQAQKITAEEFQSSKAEQLNQMSPSFRALVQKATEDQVVKIPQSENDNGTKSIQDDISKHYGLPKNSPYGTVAGILLICTGAFILFFGQKAFKPILFFCGFYAFGVFTYALLNYLRTHGTINIENNVGVIYFFAILGGGLLGGGFFLCLWKIGPFLFGGLLGAVVGLIFLELPFTTTFSRTIRIVILGVLIFIGIVLAGFFEKSILIVSTAVLGSYWFFCGGDVFLKTGFGSLVAAVSDKQKITMTVGTWLMMVGFILMSIIGSIVQFRTAREKERVIYEPAPTKV